MNILVAMNSFKGSLSSLKANKVVSAAVQNLNPEVQINQIPLVDGGTGSLEAWAHVLKTKPIRVTTVDPLGREIKALLLIYRGKAFIEMAEASGIHLLKQEELNVLKANTYGTGLLIKEALKCGCSEVYVGLGGSATHDLGTGILRALGVRFYDKLGRELETPRDLLHLHAIDDTQLNKIKNRIKINLLCDVDNPLLGETGAARIFAPQKGAINESILQHCEQLSKCFVEYFKEQDILIGNKAGDGAAGGIPALLGPLLNAKIQSGAEFTTIIGGIEEKLKTTDLVITGEGNFDEQSFYGKGPGTIIRKCSKLNIPVIVLTGGYQNINIASDRVSIFSISPYPAPKSQSIKNVVPWLSQAAYNAVKLYCSGYYQGYRKKL